MIEYKGYAAKIEFDSDADLFHGQVLNLRDVITFQGRSVDELHSEFQNSVDDYLEFCAERGERPEKPFSGRFVVRIEPELHRAVATEAAREDRSINAWIVQTIESSLQRRKHLTASLHAYRDLWPTPIQGETLVRFQEREAWNLGATAQLDQLIRRFLRPGSDPVVKRHIPTEALKVELTTVGEGYRHAS